MRAAQQHQGGAPTLVWRDSIQLAACRPTETLPMNPDLPADVFTACLTTPIEMSLRWVVMRNPLLNANITLDMVLSSAWLHKGASNATGRIKLDIHCRHRHYRMVRPAGSARAVQATLPSGPYCCLHVPQLSFG